VSIGRCALALPTAPAGLAHHTVPSGDPEGAKCSVPLRLDGAESVGLAEPDAHVVGRVAYQDAPGAPLRAGEPDDVTDGLPGPLDAGAKERSRARARLGDRPERHKRGAQLGTLGLVAVYDCFRPRLGVSTAVVRVVPPRWLAR
jgi:hypothetical protein